MMLRFYINNGIINLVKYTYQQGNWLNASLPNTIPVLTFYVFVLVSVCYNIFTEKLPNLKIHMLLHKNNAHNEQT